MSKVNLGDVQKLREMTSMGILDCKKALDEANGDMEKAIELLRKRGAAVAAKRGDNATAQGIVHAYIHPGGTVGVLVEINCETDFVARNDSFRSFGEEIARKLAENPNANLEAEREAAVAKIGENIKITRNARMEVSGNGLIAAYIHAGSKIGVLVEVGSGKETTPASDQFKQLVKDITLQIAAGHPFAVSREQVAPAVIAKEREIAAQSDRLKDKPAAAMEKILQGVIDKFYQTYCLVDQGFVKMNSEISVKEHVANVAKQLDDEIVIRRFVRFQVGEVEA